MKFWQFLTDGKKKSRRNRVEGKDDDDIVLDISNLRNNIVAEGTVKHMKMKQSFASLNPC